MDRLRVFETYSVRESIVKKLSIGYPSTPDMDLPSVIWIDLSERLWFEVVFDTTTMLRDIKR